MDQLGTLQKELQSQLALERMESSLEQDRSSKLQTSSTNERRKLLPSDLIPFFI
jgi:hypothetical protein